jgi:hypothetical protein
LRNPCSQVEMKLGLPFAASLNDICHPHLMMISTGERIG